MSQNIPKTVTRIKRIKGKKKVMKSPVRRTAIMA
jgi:hypothetical protein